MNEVPPPNEVVGNKVDWIDGRDLSNFDLRFLFTFSAGALRQIVEGADEVFAAAGTLAELEVAISRHGLRRKTADETNR